MESKLIGKKVIARIDNAGVNYGTLEAKDSEILRMTDVRKIYYWEGALAVTDMSCNGLTGGKISGIAKSVEFQTKDVIEICECTDKAVKSIEAIKVWKR